MCPDLVGAKIQVPAERHQHRIAVRGQRAEHRRDRAQARRRWLAANCRHDRLAEDDV
jgi:hypothetical protein